jgi:hypothetical protein
MVEETVKLALAEAKTRLILEFESLITIILDGPSSSSLSRLSSPNATTDDWGSEEPQTLSQQGHLQLSWLHLMLPGALTYINLCCGKSRMQNPLKRI